MASSGVFWSRRSTSSAKSIIMMAFFFTMPISRMMPISAITLSSVFVISKREDCADTGGRQGGKNSNGMNEALVENSEDNVNSNQCSRNQDRLIGERRLEMLAPFPESWC